MEYVYAALLLHKLGREVNEENLKKILASAGTEVDDSKIKSLTASLKGVDIDKELESASLVAGTTSAPSEEKEEEKEEKAEEKEEKKEAAAEGLSSLFG